MRIFFLSLFIVFTSQSFARKKPELHPEVKASYLKLLEQAPKIHEALKAKDKKILQTEITKTQEIIPRLYQKNSYLQIHHRIHSFKLLAHLEEQLNSLEAQSTPNKKNVRNLFHSFFELASVYNLNKEMKGSLFYCGKDKSHWIQSANSKVYNPIHSRDSSCGRTIL